MVDDTKNKAAKMVKGEELETMLQEWEQPLVVDAYATWYGILLYVYYVMHHVVYAPILF